MRREKARVRERGRERDGMNREGERRGRERESWGRIGDRKREKERERTDLLFTQLDSLFLITVHAHTDKHSHSNTNTLNSHTNDTHAKH